MTKTFVMAMWYFCYGHLSENKEVLSYIVFYSGIQCIMKEYWTILNHLLKLVKYILLDNGEIETNQIHLTDNI